MILYLQWIKSLISTKIKTNLGKGAWEVPQDEKGTRLHEIVFEQCKFDYCGLFQDLEIFMDPTRNFVKYRNLLKGSERPLIPYFPVAKKDLTFIYLGNDSMVEHMVCSFLLTVNMFTVFSLHTSLMLVVNTLLHSIVILQVNFEKLRIIAREVKNCRQYCLTPIMVCEYTSLLKVMCNIQNSHDL